MVTVGPRWTTRPRSVAARVARSVGQPSSGLGVVASAVVRRGALGDAHTLGRDRVTSADAVLEPTARADLRHGRGAELAEDVHRLDGARRAVHAGVDDRMAVPPASPPVRGGKLADVVEHGEALGLPVAPPIRAAPIGLDAADRGWSFTIYEATSTAGGSVREWGTCGCSPPGA